ncbi:LacI family DNA-binding transcriptional regulator [Acidicapsa ligni]|uniref:LacI family DNA-binding transcriptional regulator n=1 Tax=Acidicapsa ligni TaxID=542300 RepID=UPI0021DFDED6|nr:LacI family DNA-binding transcriptional regulator [Acidicapsa ligni]
MSERTKFTMRDVARLANVSTSTVSAVINETVAVSPERKKRVQDAMAALDYHPDEVARSLKTGRTNVIGVVIPDITNAFYPEVISGVEEAARQAGYGVLFCNSSEDAHNEARHLAMLSARRVDGVILACCATPSAFDAVIRRRFPMVFVDRVPPGTIGSTVSSDNVDAGYEATKHLIKLGHKRIAMLIGTLDLSPHRDRLDGFRKAMQEYHLPIRDEYLIGGGVQIEDGRKAGLQLLACSPCPTAIVVSNNKLLLGLFEAIDKRKIKIPAQLSVVGFDDYVWNRYVTPSLTVIAQPTGEMGRCAFELLHQIINASSNDVITKQIQLKTELHVRNSTAAPAPEPRKK